jgi:hypothetical protein
MFRSIASRRIQRLFTNVRWRTSTGARAAHPQQADRAKAGRGFEEDTMSNEFRAIQMHSLMIRTVGAGISALSLICVLTTALTLGQM